MLLGINRRWALREHRIEGLWLLRTLLSLLLKDQLREVLLLEVQALQLVLRFLLLILLNQILFEVIVVNPALFAFAVKLCCTLSMLRVTPDDGLISTLLYSLDSLRLLRAQVETHLLRRLLLHEDFCETVRVHGWISLLPSQAARLLLLAFQGALLAFCPHKFLTRSGLLLVLEEITISRTYKSSIAFRRPWSMDSLIGSHPFLGASRL